jgi:SAM-dependent methyltransferase
MFPPGPGQRVLDVGCGFGDSSQRIAAIVGPEGHVVGVDAARNFVELASGEAAEAGIANLSFELADVQSEELGGPYDMAFSRFGTMFFANPVAALRNVRSVLVPGGRLVMVVWRQRTDNDWMYRAQTIVERFAQRPEDYDEPTCGPGPFSMANADTVSDVLLHAGYQAVELHRCDRPMLAGGSMEQAIDIVMSLGPGGEILRLLGDRAKHLHEPIRQALREGLADFDRPDGVRAPSSTWIVSATAP